MQQHNGPTTSLGFCAMHPSQNQGHHSAGTQTGPFVSGMGTDHQRCTAPRLMTSAFISQGGVGERRSLEGIDWIHCIHSFWGDGEPLDQVIGLCWAGLMKDHGWISDQSLPFSQE